MARLAKSLRFLMVFLALSGNAHATFHLWEITQLYSNADGTVQYIELTALSNGQEFLSGHTVAVTQGSTTHTYTFTSNLPGDTATTMGGDSIYGGGATSFKSLLLATQGFANLGIVTPDFIIPDGFLFTTNGHLNWGGGFDMLDYTSLPTDGRNALFRGGTVAINAPLNFAGAMGTVAPPSFNVEGLWWRAPANSEPGWGMNLTHQGDVVFATWFTYDTDGSGMWLVMTGAKTADNTYSGTLYRTTGPSFDSTPYDATKFVATAVGTGTLTFTDHDNGTFAYTVNSVSQTKPITREVFASPVPTCTTGGTPGAVPNYQDLWWHSPANSEPGWGINLTHQGDIIFATWFTYGTDGKGLWIVMTGTKSAPNTYGGTLYRTSGSAFSAAPYDPTKFVPTEVGNGTFTFSDANNGVFAYTLNGVTQSKPITREVFQSPATVCK